MTVRYLTTIDILALINIVSAAAQQKGPDFYGWKESPKYDVSTGKWTHETGWGDNKKTRIISAMEAEEIFKAKLNGAYGERFMLLMAYVVAAVSKGVKVAFLQMKEDDTPFDPEGWLVLSIDGHPYFHLAPWDLPVAEVEAAGFVTVVREGTPEADEHKWTPEVSGNGKPDEFEGLLRKLLN